MPVRGLPVRGPVSGLSNFAEVVACPFSEVRGLPVRGLSNFVPVRCLSNFGLSNFGRGSWPVQFRCLSNFGRGSWPGFVACPIWGG